MKKSRVLLLVTVLLVFATTLSSCGSVSTLGAYLNPDYDLTTDVYAKATNLPGLEGYSILDSVTDSDMIVFYQADTKDDGSVIISYKLFSMASGTVVKELVGDKNTVYSFEALDGAPAIQVKTTALDATNIDMTPAQEDVELVALAEAVTAFHLGLADEMVMDVLEDYLTVTYALYDLTGAVIADTRYDAEVSYFADLVVYDWVAYEVNEDTGAWTKKIEIPEYMALENLYYYTDNYYYGYGEDSISVYDLDLKPVSVFMLPTCSDESIVDVLDMDIAAPIHILNNGDILYQYFEVQDEDAKKYDISWVEDGVTFKYNMVSLLFSAEKGTVKELDLDYVVQYIMPNEMLYDEDLDAAENPYNQEFENIALIAPIEDHRILTAEDKIDLVLMNNKAKAGKSLKVVDNQAAMLSYKIGDDLYQAYMLDGSIVLINAKGEIISTMNKELTQVGSYFVGETAIYDLSLEKVQDLKDPDVSYEILGETILVTTKQNSKEYTVVAFRDGETKTIYTHTKDSDTTLEINAEFGYYCIIDETENYKYYNEKGAELVVTKRPLEAVYANDYFTTLLLVGHPVDVLVDKPVYYVFSK